MEWYFYLNLGSCIFVVDILPKQDLDYLLAWLLLFIYFLYYELISYVVHL